MRYGRLWDAKVVDLEVRERICVLKIQVGITRLNERSFDSPKLRILSRQLIFHWANADTAMETFDGTAKYA